MKKFSVLLLLLMLISGRDLLAQNSKIDTLTISTTAVCDMCVNTIEKNFAFEKGVKSTQVNLEKNIVTIEYRADKTSPEQLKLALASFGYAADDTPADPKAFKKLHECCKIIETDGTD
jgi:mercuric ion binding protein